MSKKILISIITVIMALNVLSVFANNNKVNATNNSVIKKINGKNIELPEGDKVYFLDDQYQTEIASYKGDVIILESQGKYGMIDLGRGKTSERVIKYIKELNISNLEFVLFTHMHTDHVGGVNGTNNLKVINDMNTNNIKIKKVYLKEYHEGNKYYNAFNHVVDTIKSGNPNVKIKYVQNQENQNITLGNIKLKLFNTQFIEKISETDTKNNDGRYENANSIVVLAEVNGRTIYFAGDLSPLVDESTGKTNHANSIPATIAKQVVNYTTNNKIDVYKAAHHGTAYMNSNKVLKTLNPEYAIITNTVYNTNIKTTVERLNARNIKYYVTGEGTTVLNITENGEMTIKQMEDYYIDSVNMEKAIVYPDPKIVGIEEPTPTVAPTPTTTPEVTPTVAPTPTTTPVVTPTVAPTPTTTPEPTPTLEPTPTTTPTTTPVVTPTVVPTPETTSTPTGREEEKNPKGLETGEEVDVILFWGQGNMLGRAGIYDNEKLEDTRINELKNSLIDDEILSQYKAMNYVSVQVPENTAFEYRINTDGTGKLMQINENTKRIGQNLTYINGKLLPYQKEYGYVSLLKSNGTNMIPQFCKTYYEKTGRKVVVVMTAVSNKKITNFLPTTDSENDNSKKQYIYEAMKTKYNSAVEYLQNNGIKVKNKFYIAMQGEADSAKYNTAIKSVYKNTFLKVHNNIKNDMGIQFGGIIKTTDKTKETVSWLQELYIKSILSAQKELAKENADIIITSKLTEKVWNESNSELYNCLERSYNNDNSGKAYNNIAHLTSATLSQIGKNSAISVAKFIK